MNRRQHSPRYSAALVILFVCLMGVPPALLWSRLVGPPGTFDLTPLIPRASSVFRGVVVDVVITEQQTLPYAAIATLKVERWYSAGENLEARVRFHTGFRIPGHDCIDFKRGSRWLIFANQREHLELVDDCFGAVAVSALMEPVLRGGDIRSQIETDLIAGLADPNPSARLDSIKGLSGFRSVAARPMLHAIIERAEQQEADWATFAALRSGDITVLPRIRETLTRSRLDGPARYLSWELSQLGDRAAIPELIRIVETSPVSIARTFAMQALGHNFEAAQALPAIVVCLKDSDADIRLSALDAMWSITHSPACNRISTSDRDNFEPTITACLAWWNQSGSKKFLTRQ